MSSKFTTSVSSPTRTTLALIPYLNCEPFYAGIADLGFGIVHKAPRWLGLLAEEGETACGPMAVVDYFRLRDRFVPLENFGIASRGAARSVLLFSKRPIQELKDASIGLTTESSTSVRLLQLLLEKKHGHRGVRYHRGENAAEDARLVIGDAALRAARRGIGGLRIVTDLGEEWLAWQKLPFVFARWAVSRDIPETDRTKIAHSLERSLDSWKSRLGEIARRRGPGLDMDEAAIANYLSAFRYRLGEDDARGEERFEELLAGAGDFSEL
jgi:chorismate dehydratase